MLKIDRAGMLNGLENRIVFTNHDLFNFIYFMPDNFKINYFETKKKLKKLIKIFAKNIYKKKHGFAFPIYDLLSNLPQKISILNLSKKKLYIKF